VMLETREVERGAVILSLVHVSHLMLIEITRLVRQIDRNSFHRQEERDQLQMTHPTGEMKRTISVLAAAQVLIDHGRLTRSSAEMSAFISRANKIA
jgi:hypothetical protein